MTLDLSELRRLGDAYREALERFDELIRDRNQWMVEARAAGWTVREIAEHAEVSRQRVHQILSRA